MNQNSYKINWYGMTDNSIVEVVCKSIKQLRLNKNISQDELSKLSGVNRITISRLENGQAINLMTMIQLLRALEQLELLSEFNVLPEVSPIKIMEQQIKWRKIRGSFEQRPHHIRGSNLTLFRLKIEDSGQYECYIYNPMIKKYLIIDTVDLEVFQRYDYSLRISIYQKILFRY